MLNFLMEENSYTLYLDRQGISFMRGVIGELMTKKTL